ncbi:unnamed protein product, partial [Rotaria magnacalcarata]
MNVCLIILLINLSNAQFNLYLDSIAVEQLFELKGYQFHFIDENQIRQAALETPLLVSADMHFVEFTWNAHSSKIDT